MARVVDDENLLGVIFARLDSLETACHTALVSKQWLTAVSDRAALKDIRARSSSPLLGFITVCSRPGWTYVRFGPLLGISGALEADAAQIEATFPPADELMDAHDDQVLFCGDARVVVRQHITAAYAQRGIRDAATTAVVAPPATPAVGGAAIPAKPTGSFVKIDDEAVFFQH